MVSQQACKVSVHIPGSGCRRNDDLDSLQQKNQKQIGCRTEKKNITSSKLPLLKISRAMFRTDMNAVYFVSWIIEWCLTLETHMRLDGLKLVLRDWSTTVPPFLISEPWKVFHTLPNACGVSKELIPDDELSKSWTFHPVRDWSQCLCEMTTLWPYNGDRVAQDMEPDVWWHAWCSDCT